MAFMGLCRTAPPVTLQIARLAACSCTCVRLPIRQQPIMMSTMMMVMVVIMMSAYSGDDAQDDDDV
jgi:hypothetical protein